MKSTLIRMEQGLTRTSVQITLTIVLVAAAVGLAFVLESQRSDRVALVEARFSDKAEQSAGLLNAIVASSPSAKQNVKVTPQVRKFLSHYLAGQSPTPGFEAAAFDAKGKLIAGSVPNILRTLRAPSRVVAVASVKTLKWKLIMSIPRAQLLKSVGSDTLAWLMLIVFGVSTLLRTILIRALARQTEELKETSIELKRTNTDLQAFATAAAHDIRAPLRRIAGFIDLVVRDEAKTLSEKSKDYLARVRRQAARLDVVVEDLVAYARAGERGALNEYVSLQKAALSAMSLLDEEIRAAKALITIPRTLPTVRGNEAGLQSVLRNVIANGIKFVEKGQQPRVELSFEDRPNEVILRVRDWGVGIDQEFREKVFKPFNRLHTFEEYEGTGLGLATVQRIVDRHGGTTHCCAPESGAGTVIEITLPKGGV